MAIRIAEVKSSSLSDDKKEVIIGGSGKYIGDVELRFAHECLDDLIDALVRAKGGLGRSANSALVPNVTASPTPKHNGGAGANPDKVRVEIPKNFTVTADTTGPGVGAAHSQPSPGEPGRLCAIPGCSKTSRRRPDEERRRRARTQAARDVTKLISGPRRKVARLRAGGAKVSGAANIERALSG